MKNYRVTIDATIETNDPDYLNHQVALFLWGLKHGGENNTGTYSVMAVRE